MASKKILTDLNIDGVLQVTGPAAGAGSIIVSDRDVGETESVSLNMIKSSTSSFVFDGQASSTLHLGSGSGLTLMELNGDSGTVNTSGDIGLNEEKKIIFDVDGDSFASIHVDNADNSNSIYNAVNQHHFKNGDDGAYEAVKAGSFVKDSGTSSQFLKADGSVDSNTYLTSSSTQSKYLRSDTADTTTGTLTAPKFFVSAATASSQWAFQGRNSSSTSDSGLYFNGGDGNLFLRNSSNSLTARIDSDGDSYVSGDFGVGTTSPDSKLHINRAESSYAVNIGNTDVRAGLKIINSTNNDSQLTFSQGGSGVQYIQASNQAGTSGKDININPYGGNVISAGTFTGTNFILSSDKRLKDNIEEVDNKTIDVDWKTFEMKEEAGQKRYGVIAQELEENHPEFVRTDDEGMKSVAYVDLLIAKIAELEARLEKLEK